MKHKIVVIRYHGIRAKRKMKLNWQYDICPLFSLMFHSTISPATINWIENVWMDDNLKIKIPDMLKETSNNENKTMNYQEYIEIKPGKRSGKPCLKGTRITVYDVLSWLANNMSHEEIMDDFPSVKEIHIQACLAYAASREQHLQSAYVA